MRRKPLFNHPHTRAIIGLLVAAASPSVASLSLGGDSGGFVAALIMVVLIWLPALFFTDRYMHKYPQRYYTYLLASHLKSVVVMVVAGLALWWFDLLPPSSRENFWMGILLFVVVDYLISLPNVSERETPSPSLMEQVPSAPAASSPSETVIPPGNVDIDTVTIKGKLLDIVSDQVTTIIRKQLPDNDHGLDTLLVLDDIDATMVSEEVTDDIGVLVGTRHLNNVSRLNNYLRYCAGRVTMGGYLIVSYIPMETELAKMKERCPSWLYPFARLWHFVWYRALPKLPWLDKIYFLPGLAWLDRVVLATTGHRKRTLPKAEMWGRLAYYGIEVIYESSVGDVKHVIAQRVTQPVANCKPSFYAVVALEKVGLDGKVIRLHKVRSMYPFSEFLQKKIFQSHGLSNTGKFKNDFRLTDYGPMIRKNWIDEIPGIFDWLQGNVKLVGMRATSPHYLSLYPEDVYQLYIQVKPGLIPPIFDEKTTGFEQIVEIERTYLSRYLRAPIKTDILYFWYTFRDIFIRKVRSS